MRAPEVKLVCEKEMQWRDNLQKIYDLQTAVYGLEPYGIEQRLKQAREIKINEANFGGLIVAASKAQKFTVVYLEAALKVANERA